MEKSLKIRFEHDTKRFHNFKVIDPNGEITGTIYFPKRMNPLPKRLVLEMKNDEPNSGLPLAD